MKKEIKSKLNVLKRINGSIWAKDEFGKNIFLKESSFEAAAERHQKRFFTIFNKVDFESKTYEACVFISGVSELFIDNLFNMIALSDLSIKASVSDIINYFSETKNVEIEMIRGLFAELFAISERNLQVNHTTSIYDFIEGGIDFEIKSFSKVKREIMVSYQQLTNSTNAKIMAVEVFESNEGEDIIEMIKKLDNLESRYTWILNSNSDLVKVKFKVGEVYVNNISELSEGLCMPTKAKSAKFIFSVDSLK